MSEHGAASPTDEILDSKTATQLKQDRDVIASDNNGGPATPDTIGKEPPVKNGETSSPLDVGEDIGNNDNKDGACGDIVKPNVVENNHTTVDQNRDVIADGKGRQVFCADTCGVDYDLQMAHGEKGWDRSWRH
jgi:hypothetical protein